MAKVNRVARLDDLGNGEEDVCLGARYFYPLSVLPAHSVKIRENYTLRFERRQYQNKRWKRLS